MNHQLEQRLFPWAPEVHSTQYTENYGDVCELAVTIHDQCQNLFTMLNRQGECPIDAHALISLSIELLSDMYLDYSRSYIECLGEHQHGDTHFATIDTPRCPHF